MNEDDLSNVIAFLKGKEFINGRSLQIEFKIGYQWADKILNYLELQEIVSIKDQWGERKIIVNKN